ncbi:hypothetical protein [Trinickia mobilis]|uniref:hypothetical protein n=1 Tax=Trinickia mobilis TaxID=2816356 RepID=UPI0028681FFF|nr:hypothetical protein [Trinickia mobilis]
MWLANGFHVRETSYGNAVSFEDGDGLHQAIERAADLDRNAVRKLVFEYTATGWLSKAA